MGHSCLSCSKQVNVAEFIPYQQEQIRAGLPPREDNEQLDYLENLKVTAAAMTVQSNDIATMGE